MKRNKSILISAILLTIYDLYIIIRTIYYLCNKTTYGDVYFEFLFYPHLICIVLATILNYIYFFKEDKKLIKYLMLALYLLSMIFLVITK